MLGSSRTYIEPTSDEPIEVAKLMRCDSPPERVDESRSSVRYPSPTSTKYRRRFWISSRILLQMLNSKSENSVFLKNSSAASIVISTRPAIVVPQIFTSSASLRRRAPPHSSHVVYPRYLLKSTRY